MFEPRTGPVGESYCRMLCAQAGLVVNAAVEDVTGWDFHIEFPDNVLDKPLTVDTLHEASPQCRVQVKTSKDEKRYDDVSLSNLRRMATDPIPAFFLFLELCHNAQVVNSYLVHVDSEMITKILKRVRKHSVNVIEDRPLNKKTMRVHAATTDVLLPNDPTCFLKALVKCIGSFEEYRRNKLSHLENTGFESGREILELAVGKNNGEISFEDVMLGLAKRIRLDSFSATLTRFGIDDPNPYIQEEGGWIEFPNLKPISAVLVFRTSSLAVPISVNVDVYRTFFPDSVDADYHRVRIAGTFLEHEFKPRIQGIYPINFSLDSPMPLSDLNMAVILMTRLVEDASSATATLVLEGDKPDLVIQVGAKSTVNIPASSCTVIGQAMSIVDRFGSSQGSAVLFRELIEHSNAISHLSSILSDAPQSFKITLDEEATSKHDTSTNVAFVAPCAAPLGQALYVALLLIQGEMVDSENDKHIVYSSSAQISRYLVLDRTKIDWVELSNQMSAVAKSVENDKCQVFLLQSGFPL